MTHQIYTGGYIISVEALRGNVMGSITSAIVYFFSTVLFSIGYQLAVFYGGVPTYGIWVLRIGFFSCLLLAGLFAYDGFKFRHTLFARLQAQGSYELRSEKYSTSFSLLIVFLMLAASFASGIYKLYSKSSLVFLDWLLIGLLTIFMLAITALATNPIRWIRDRFLLFK